MRTLKIAVLAFVLAPVAAFAAGSIEGSVEFTGKVPTAAKLRREADPFCAKKPMSDPSVTVKDKKLANVWVRVSKGAPASKAEAKEITVDQKDCMYEPRMQFTTVGSKIKVHNSDPVLHNVHSYLGAATVFNKGMPNQDAKPVEHTADKAGMIKFKCDVHPWMRGFVGVNDNPFQAIAENGEFKIKDVPPGKYTLEAWHEKFGAKTQEVTVEEGKPAKVTFSYAGTEKGT
jgi:plastocyanin